MSAGSAGNVSGESRECHRGESGNVTVGSAGNVTVRSASAWEPWQGQGLRSAGAFVARQTLRESPGVPFGRSLKQPLLGKALRSPTQLRIPKEKWLSNSQVKEK